MEIANDSLDFKKVEESKLNSTKSTVDSEFSLQSSKDFIMTRRDIECCSDETCSQYPAAVMEEHPKQMIDNTGSESFYEPDCKQPSIGHVNSNYSFTSLVPDIDGPREQSPDIPHNQMASKKLFQKRYFEAENASKMAEVELQGSAKSRPAIIQWAPSKGHQHNAVHNLVKDSLSSANTTTAGTTSAVTRSVPVHKTPVMSGWTKDTQTDSHIHHADQLPNGIDFKLGTKFHCKEGPKDKAVDLTSTRHTQETFTNTNFITPRIPSAEQALDLSVSRKTPSPTNSCNSRTSPPLSPSSSSMPLTPNSSASFAEQFQALTTEEVATLAKNKAQSGYVDLNRLQEIYTHNINAMVKSQAHDSKWDDNIQNPNTTKIYPRAMTSNGVKAAPVTVNVQNTESGKMYQCQLCGVMFKHRHHVVRHMRSHTGEKPFQCMECGARFARKCILTNHMRVHTGEKPFICRECGDMFSRKHHLVIHVRTHTGEKPYCCGKCGAAFSRSHHLGRHMKTHEPKRGIDGTEHTIEHYQCSKCPAKFAHANSLSRHVKSHNNATFDSKFLNPSNMASNIPSNMAFNMPVPAYTTEAASSLSKINHRASLPSNSFPSPFSNFALAFPDLTTTFSPTAIDRVKIENKLDSIPVPNTNVEITPSSLLKPTDLSFSFEHSATIKEETIDTYRT